MTQQTKNIQTAVVIESTPNVYEAPTVGTDFDEMVEAPNVVTDQETVERTVVRGSLGDVKDRRGSRIATAGLSLELKSSNGVSAGHTDEPRLMKYFDLLLGSKITTTANAAVSGGGSTDTVINTDVSDWAVGEIVNINDEVRHVKSESGADITLNVALDSAPIDTDVILRGHTAKPNSGDQRRVSVTTFNQPVGVPGWREKLIGEVIASASFEDNTNGSIPKVNFQFDGADYLVEKNITNAITPIFENSVPPDNLNVFMIIGGFQTDSNNWSMTVDKEVTPQNVITNASGILSRVATSRKISGSFDYYPSDVDSVLFDLFNSNTTTDQQITWGEVDGSGNFIQGTIISIYLPAIQLNGGSAQDEDNFQKRVVPFKAFETNVLDSEVFIAFL